MNNSVDSAYCRLCADIKPHKTLVNLQKDEEMCQQVVDKLSKFYIMMDFQDNVLPNTVCLACVKCLEQAFTFVNIVEQAQAFLRDFILVYVKPTKSEPCEENMLSEPPDSSIIRVIVIKDEDSRESTELNDNDTNLSEKCDSEVMSDVSNDECVTSASISSSHAVETYFVNTEELENENINDIKPSLDILEENTNKKEDCDVPDLTGTVSDLHHNGVDKNLVKNEKNYESMEISDDDVLSDKCNSAVMTDSCSDNCVASGNNSSSHADDIYIGNTEELDTEIVIVIKPSFDISLENTDTNNKCDQSKPGLSPDIISDLDQVVDNINTVDAVSAKVHNTHSEPLHDTVRSKQNRNKQSNANASIKNIVKNTLKEKVKLGKNKLITTPLSSEKNKTKKRKSNYQHVVKYSDVDVTQIKQTWQDYEWKCSACGTIFPNIEELQSHSMQYHNACNLYQCMDCTSRRSKLNVFMTHVKTHKQRNYLAQTCYRCFRIFPKRDQTTTHQRKIHDCFYYFCPGCNTPFDTNQELKAHTNKYFNKITTIIPSHLTCGVCNEKSENVKEFKKHSLTHKSVKDWFCETCGKRCKTKGYLKEHIYVAHENPEKSFHCDICKGSFCSKHRLSNHIKLHSPKTPYICDFCRKTFRTKTSIAIHMVKHGASHYKRFACTVCNKKFNWIGSVKQHMLQHTGERPFSCHICLRDFTNMANRNKHVKRRHGIEMSKKRSLIGKKQTTPNPPGALP